MIPSLPPLFRFGRGRSLLGCFSGTLLFDSGEADNTFFFRCQDRYLVYGALSRIRPLLFVTGGHMERYAALLDCLMARIGTVSQRTGVPLPARISPFYVPLEADTLTVAEAGWFFEQETPGGYSLVFNQISPTCAGIFRQLREIQRSRGSALLTADELTVLSRGGSLALRWHDKAEYVELAASSPGGLPPHVPTRVLDPAEFLTLKGWEDLQALFGSREAGAVADSFYVKSSLDSGGNVAAKLTREDFSEALPALRREIENQVLCESASEAESLRQLRRDVELAPSLRASFWTDARLLSYVRRQRERRKRAKVLVQPFVEAPEAASVQGIGVTGTASQGPLFAAGQLYRDGERRHFLGSYVHDGVSSSILTPEFDVQMRRLCSLFAHAGYRGPLSFDARLGTDGRWVLLYDCNPRLTAVYPALAVFQYLRRIGWRCDSVISLGYRGEWNRRPLEDWLDQLETAGLLYGMRRNRGVLPLPSLARDNGCDLVALNLPPEELNDLLAMPCLCAGHLQSVY
jgi:hypothetical protein